MGVSIEGFVSEYKGEFDIEKFSKIFDKKAKQISSEEYYSKYRNESSNLFEISFTKDNVWVYNNQLTKYFIENDTVFIDKLNSFFSSPENILAFQEIDSAGATGFTLIVNGQKVRHRYFCVGRPLQEYGEPLDIENKWTNGNITFEKYDEDSFEYYKLFSITEDGIQRYSTEEGLTRTIFYELLESKFVMIPWDKRPELEGFNRVIYIEMGY
jgi:hypothetical protein